MHLILILLIFGQKQIRKKHKCQPFPDTYFPKTREGRERGQGPFGESPKSRPILWLWASLCSLWASLCSLINLQASKLHQAVLMRTSTADLCGQYFYFHNIYSHPFPLLSHLFSSWYSFLLLSTRFDFVLNFSIPVPTRRIRSFPCFNII